MRISFDERELFRLCCIKPSVLIHQQGEKLMRIMIAILLTVTAAVSTSAQKISKPTLTAKECTSAQMNIIREGIALHDAKKYDAAVEKYEIVRTDNPDCTLAIYEVSMTYYAMGEKTKAMETAYAGSKYKSEELPLFYLVMGNVIDDIGKPDEAVTIYRDAIKMLDGDPDKARYLASLHFNLGVTFAKQKKHHEARAELKKAVEYNYEYASPNYLLSLMYRDSNYKVPAFLAAARFLAMELTSQRSVVASQIIRDVLKPAQKNDKTGNIDIFVNLDAPKDEGDFAMFELFLGTLTTVKGKEDKSKTEEEMFVKAVGTLIALVAENKGVGSTFVGKNYVPFLTEMKNRGYGEVLAYVVLHHTGSDVARSWLNSNQSILKDFAAWVKAYRPPR